jgi:RNA polymerase sigma-70 factor (ECF subfamily)
MSEKELINKLKNGNEKAFKTLVENHQSMVINTCYGLLQNHEDAEDIAQNVFIELFNSIGSFRGEAKLTTWLYRIAVNRSINHLRKKRQNKWLHFFESNSSSTPTANNIKANITENPEYNIENEQRSLIIKEAIESLSNNQKVAFTLNKYEELSYKEIAEIMELSVSSVESLLFRAKKNLQKRLIKFYEKKCI